MNYRTLSLVLGLCLLLTMGLLAETRISSARFSAAKAVYWPIMQPQVVMPQPVSAWNHPDSLDSVNAAPENHRVVYEDDIIRLLEVVILPGEKEPLHGHKYSSVFAFDAVQPAVHDHTPDGKLIDRKRSLMDKELPTCFSRGPEELHAAENVDTFPQHFYRLEFKKIYGKDIQNVHWHRVGKTLSREE